MASFLLDISSDFKDLNKEATGLTSGFSELADSFKNSNGILATTGKAFETTAGSAFKLFNAVNNLSDISQKAGAIVTVAVAGNKAFREFSQAASALDFSSAITGSDELANNFAILDKTSNAFVTTASEGFNQLAIGIQQSIGLLTGSGGFEEWSGQAVSAFAAVEDAAFRTSTVLVSGNTKSIDILDDTIGQMRKLQDATNSTVDSISLLNAQYDIASAGFASASDSLNVGTAAINLNEAGYGNLTETTGALVKTLNALGEGSDNAGKRAAQLFGIAKVGLTTIPELSSEIGSLASLGKQLGLEFEEVSTALAVLTTQGLSTSEATTALTNLLLDVSSGSEQAQQALAGFQDQAGKPIQLNAQSLKEDGISGIIEKLEAATGGRVDALQKVFSNQSSQQGAQLLIGAGQSNFEKAEETISSSDPSVLAEEAAGRTKTLQGAFEQASNKSRTYLEELGQGLQSSVIDRLTGLNTLTQSIGTTSGTAIGSITGALDAVGTKAKAVGGFLLTAFTAVAGIVVFDIITKKLGAIVPKIQELIGKIQQGRKEGESWWDFLYRSALENLAKLSVKFEAFVNELKGKIQSIKQNIESVGNADISPNVKIDAPDAINVESKEVKSETRELTNKSNNVSNQESNRSRNIETNDNLITNNIRNDINNEEVNRINNNTDNERVNRLENEKIRTDDITSNTNVSRRNVENNIFNTSTNTDKNSTENNTRERVNRSNSVDRVVNNKTNNIGQTLNNVFDNLTNQIDTIRNNIFNRKTNNVENNTTSNKTSNDNTDTSNRVRNEQVNRESTTTTKNRTTNSTFSNFDSGDFDDLIKSNDKLDKATRRSGGVLGNLKKGLSGVGNAAKTVAGEGFSLLGGTIAKSAGALVGLGAAAGVGLGAFVIATSWLDTFFKVADTRTIPAVQELRSSLQSLSDLDSIKQLVDDLDTTKASLDEMSYGAAVFQESISRAGGLWNNITGQALQTSIAVGTITEAQKRLNEEVEKELEARSRGQITANTDEERATQRKIELGLVLNGEDERIINNQTDTLIQATQERINQQRNKITQTQQSGGINRDKIVEQLQQELTVMEQQAEAQKEQLEQSRDRILSQSKLTELANLDTSIPLAVQLNVQSLRQSQGQLDNLREQFGKVFSGENIDPSAFSNLIPQVSSTLDTLKIQAAVDPNAAKESFDALNNIEGFDKLIFSDANIRQQVGEFAKSLTDAIIQQADLIKTANTSVLESVAQLGNNAPEINLVKNRAEIDSINESARALTEEYNAQYTSQARQIEISAQLEQLEAKRVELAAQVQIDSELGGRKQLLSIQSQLLEIDKARLGLFSEENKFGTFTVSIANARLAAAQQELAVKQEQLAIDNRSKDITNQAGITALKDRRQRVENNGNSFDNAVNNTNTNVLPDSSTTNNVVNNANNNQELSSNNPVIEATNSQTDTLVSNENTNFDSLLAQLDANSQREIEAIRSTAENNANNAKTEFSRDEQRQVAQALSRNDDARKQLGINTTNVEDITNQIFKDGELIDSKAVSDALRQNLGGATNNVLTRSVIGAENSNFNSEQNQAFDVVQSKLNDIANQRVQGRNDAEESVREVNQRTEQRREAIQQSRSQIQEQETSRRQQIGQLDESIAGAERGASIDSVLGDLKSISDLFAARLEISRATIEKEFASRESLIQQNEALYESFNSLSSTVGNLFSNTSVGSELTQFNNQINPETTRIQQDLEKTIAGFNAQLQVAQQVLNDTIGARNSAIAAGAPQDVIDSLNKKIEEAQINIQITRQEVSTGTSTAIEKANIDRLNAEIKSISSALEAELNVREQIINNSESLASSFSNLASTADSLFSSSAVGASLNRAATQIRNPRDAAIERGSINQERIDNRLEVANMMSQSITGMIESAQRRGASDEEIDGLVQRRNNIESEAKRENEVDTERNRQETILNALNGSLEEFGSAVNETTTLMQKTGDIIKETLDFNLQLQKNNADFNEATRSLEEAFLGLSKSNNPFAEVRSQRIEVDRINEQSEIKRAEAITDSRQQFIDLTILDAQLALEEKGYENALTQTQILSDVVSVLSGEERQFTQQGGDANSFVNSIPQLLESNRQITEQRQGLIGEQLAALPQQLQDRLSNIDAENAASRVQALSQNPNSANIPLLRDALSDVNQLRRARETREIDSNAGVSNEQFNSRMQGLNQIFSNFNPSSDSNSNNQLLNQTLSNNNAIREQLNNTISSSASINTSRGQQASNPVSINSPINLTVQMQGNTNNTSELAAQFRGIAQTTVNQGLTELSKQVLAQSRR